MNLGYAGLTTEHVGNLIRALRRNKTMNAFILTGNGVSRETCAKILSYMRAREAVPFLTKEELVPLMQVFSTHMPAEAQIVDSL